MTRYDALSHCRSVLKGSQLTAELLGREPGQYVPVRRDALELLLNEPVRPMGVVEAQRIRDARGDCRECGTPLTPHDATRATRLPDQTKYHGICHDCVMVKAGLL